MNLLYLFIMGLAAGIVDILPMIKMKIDRYSTASAFVFHLIAPFVLYYLRLDVVFWLKGGLVYLVLAIPTILLAAKDDKKSVPIMAVTSVIIGTVIGLVQYNL